MLFLSDEALCISSYWRNRPITGGEFLVLTRQFLERIQHSFPSLTSLKVVVDPNVTDGVIADDYSNLEQRVVEALPTDWAYLNPDPSNRDFTRDSLAAVSFRCAFVLSDPAHSQSSDCALYVQVSVGSPNGSTDTVNIYIAPRVESAEFVKKLLRECVEHWSPHHSLVSSGAIDSELDQPLGEVYVGWLTYLTDIGARDFLPQDAIVQNLHSGILIQVGEQPISIHETDRIAKLKHIVETLRLHGYLRNQ